MNTRIRELVEQARQNEPFECSFSKAEWLETFARLVAKECLNACKQEWYDLNNAPVDPGESPRDVGFRVGEKAGVMKCVNKIHEIFGDKI
jgi:hypothetical protein